ncbi:701_t:CDS:2 [Funneliformis mosseae]|uniref:701_t:CDS:1 n=1 Tax=Funneliformis mosseae TaxID=27381 RepID=A0A9N9AYU2_FUNMO|nr:701_t:CDS:2 [Funneliformis mosseae]
MLYVIKETWMFLSFMILVMIEIAHSFLLLLEYPDYTNLTEKISSSTLFTGGSTDLKIQNDFDRTEDNPAKNFFTSFLSRYNWLKGDFLQQDTWNFWAVNVITFIGSILLVTILQNMFIAFMGGVYSKAYEKGRVALLRFRAESISDYEALDKIYFYPQSPEPKYIYYIGKSKKDDYSVDDDSSETEKENEEININQLKEINSKIDKLLDAIITADRQIMPKPR